MAKKSKAAREAAREKRALKAYSGHLVRGQAGKLQKHRGYLRVYQNSIELAISRPSSHKKPVGKRGIIREYSDRSRGRFIRMMNRLRWPAGNAFFGSITYTDYFQDDPERVKDDLKALWQRIERRYPEAALVWRMEPKRRKRGDNAGKVAPHFHFVLFGAGQDVAEIWDFIRCAWTDLIFDPERGSKADPADYCAALEFGTDVREVENRQHAIWYVTKYMAKNDAPDPICDENGEIVARPGWGRMWGIYGRCRLNFSPLIQLAFTQLQVVAFKLLVEQWLLNDTIKKITSGRRVSNFLGRYREFAEWMGVTLYADAVEFAEFFLANRGPTFEPGGDLPGAWFRPAAGETKTETKFPDLVLPPKKLPSDFDRDPEPVTKKLLDEIASAILPLKKRLENLGRYA